MDVTGTTRILLHYAEGPFTADEKKYGMPLEDVDAEHPANCITSGPRYGGWHMPILDVDDSFFRIVPSKTPGHQHVYIDKPIPYTGLVKLLNVLAELDIIDREWVDLCATQGTATLRLPREDPVGEPSIPF